jgi:hypothetical protein
MMRGGCWPTQIRVQLKSPFARARTRIKRMDGNMLPADYGLTRAAYDVPSLIEISSLGRTKLYEYIKNGVLRPTKVGTKTLFLTPDVTAFLNHLREVA